MLRYNPKNIETKWQKKWRAAGTYDPDLARAKKPFYNLMMFPYPSAEGLHVGNVYAFVGADIYGRFERMQGHDVFEPIGLDGFGIHSENYALKINKHPMAQAKISEKNFYRQLGVIGNGFSWESRLETYDPEYYKWTQWIFTEMFRKGLAYRKKAPVNWCTSCKTVLADEQVVQEKCERCSSKVIKKNLEQWFFKITDYAERLLKNLDTIDWSERVKIAQKNWIGKSEGALIDFVIKDTGQNVPVFTTRPDTLFGATFLVLGPEHAVIPELKMKNSAEVKKYVQGAKKKPTQERLAEEKEKTGVELKGIAAINSANGEEIPVWIADYVLGNVGTGAIMAVPAHDARDFAFAKKYKLSIREVICPHDNKSCPASDQAYDGGSHLVASGKFDGMPSEKAKNEIIKFVDGKKKIQYRLRDWLVSRQRYWGPPIPMIQCDACGWVPVPESDLPVLLPNIKNFRPLGKGESPLASVSSFYKTVCPKCRGPARRETDVSDTFLDSAWYYLAYVGKEGSKFEIQNSKFRQRVKRWLPVDMYIGGAEHSVLHLLYSRFLGMVFREWGLTDFEEPFTKFRAHGLIIKDGAKMSKSKGNVINPDEYIRAYGADALRMYLMFIGPFEQGGDFRDSGMKGITRFLERVWKFMHRSSPAARSEVESAVHKAIKKVTEDIESLHYNTAISALMVLLNEFEAHPDGVSKKNRQAFLQLLAPFAPHICEELWQGFYARRAFRSVHVEAWPSYNLALTKDEMFTLIIQVNGRVRDRGFVVPAGGAQKELETQALRRVRAHLEGKKPKKVIFVPGRLINFVM